MHTDKIALPDMLLTAGSGFQNLDGGRPWGGHVGEAQEACHPAVDLEGSVALTCDHKCDNAGTKVVRVSNPSQQQ
jgi:hypothetical protein